MKIDFLIIGQGLAGSLLAFELIQQGFKVAIIDNGLENASQVAAGLINPVTGMRFVKSTNVDFLLPSAKKYYKSLALFFQQAFYVEKPMLRILKSAQEYENAKKRLINPDYAPYLENIIESKQFNSSVLKQKQTGYLLTVPLLNALKTFFIHQQCYQKYSFNYNEINLTDSVEYQHFKAKKIIFCEGFFAVNNPWFSYLPFQLVKGEILTLKNEQPLINKLLNYGQWMIPLDDYNFRIGATFDRENIDTQITTTGRAALLKNLHRILPETTKAKLIKQQANIRPCTLDKQPFIGLHPKHPQLAIFNGFGAKGSLQIPYYCQQFIAFLSKNAQLAVNVDSQRYRDHLN
jgi:glycine/D-amino acid oxidase-like deaminating enzyme